MGEQIISLHFVVAGTPVPQGSTRAFLIKGRPVITHANKGTMAWRERIAHEAQVALNGRNMLDNESAYELRFEFFFSLPKSKISKKWWFMHTTKPDIDKLARSGQDALTGIIYHDDSQVTKLSVSKDYIEEGKMPCAKVSIWKLPGKVPR